MSAVALFEQGKETMSLSIFFMVTHEGPHMVPPGLGCLSREKSYTSLADKPSFGGQAERPEVQAQG